MSNTVRQSSGDTSFSRPEHLRKDIMEIHDCSLQRTARHLLKKKKKVFQQFNLKRAFCNFNPMQMADYYDANQLSLRITATWKRSLSYTMVFLLCSRAGGERNGASVIVIPEVTPRNSPEGTEWRLGDRISRLATSMGFCSQLN